MKGEGIESWGRRMAMQIISSIGRSGFQPMAFRPFKMGQNQMAQGDRDAMLSKLASAFQQAAQVDAFSARGVDSVLQPTQAAAWKTLLAQASNLRATAQNVQSILQSPDPTQWVIDPVTLQQANDYVSDIQQLSAIMSNPAFQKTPTVPQVAPPGDQILGLPAPLVYIGGGALGICLLLALVSPN